MNNHDETFELHLSEFNGPLSLLYELIKKSEMNIYDIKITQITDQYLSYLEHLKKLNFELAGEYFVLAADLMAIKSKMLLPQPEIIDDEEDADDPRADLVHRLLVYQQYQDTAQNLNQRLLERQQVHSRSIIIPTKENHDYQNIQMSVKLLKTAFHRVIEKNNFEEPTVNIHKWEFSIQDQIEIVKQTLISEPELNLISFLEQHAQIEELITTFLAILEMAKQGELKIIEVKNQIILKSNG